MDLWRCVFVDLSMYDVGEVLSCGVVKLQSCGVLELLSC